MGQQRLENGSIPKKLFVRLGQILFKKFIGKCLIISSKSTFSSYFILTNITQNIVLSIFTSTCHSSKANDFFLPHRPFHSESFSEYPDGKPLSAWRNPKYC